MTMTETEDQEGDTSSQSGHEGTFGVPNRVQNGEGQIFYDLIDDPPDDRYRGRSI